MTTKRTKNTCRIDCHGQRRGRGERETVVGHVGRYRRENSGRKVESVRAHRRRDCQIGHVARAEHLFVGVDGEERE